MGSFTEGKGDVDGYAAIRSTIIGAGIQFVLCMAPFYANDDQVARALLKVAAETCQANEVVSVTS